MREDFSMTVEGKVIATNVIGTSTGDILISRNPYLYRAYRYDRETGLYYLNSRYYDPETGRFINADVFVSTGQGVLGNNMFAYCLNNPVNMIDRNGTAANYELMPLLVPDYSSNPYDTNTKNHARIAEYIRDDQKKRQENRNKTEENSSTIPASIVNVVEVLVRAVLPVNLAPVNATRNAAFRAAKRDLGIPMREQPVVTSSITYETGKPVTLRTYSYSEGRISIRDDCLGHSFSDGGGLGPHFNSELGHYFYKIN